MNRLGRRGAPLAVELVIVVFGVLIALWADGFVQSRAERGTLEDHLRAVRDELREAVAGLDETEAEQAIELAALRTLAELRDPSALPDSVLAWTVSAGLTNVNTFDPSLAALEDLESSGLIPSIRGRELRLAFSRLREELNLERAESALNLTGAQQAWFDPFVLEEFPFVWREMAGLNTADSDVPVRYEWEGLTTPRGRGIVGMRYDFLRSMAETWDDLRTELEEAIELIAVELGERQGER